MYCSMIASEKTVIIEALSTAVTATLCPPKKKSNSFIKERPGHEVENFVLLFMIFLIV